MNPESSVLAHNDLSETGFHKLGKKAMWFFVIERSASTLLFVILECVLIVLKVASLTSTSLVKIIAHYPIVSPSLDYTIGGVLILAIVIFALTLLSAFVSYAAFKYRIDESGFALERGIIGKDEISLPFRQIQNVDLEQPLSYRLFGMCKLTILTAGHEDKDSSSQDESEIELPALSLTEAQNLQRLLLERANVQEVVTARSFPESKGPVGATSQ